MLIKSKKKKQPKKQKQNCNKCTWYQKKLSYSDEKNIDHLTFKVGVSKSIFSSSYIHISPLIRQSDNTLIIYTL